MLTDYFHLIFWLHVHKYSSYQNFVKKPVISVWVSAMLLVKPLVWIYWVCQHLYKIHFFIPNPKNLWMPNYASGTNQDGFCCKIKEKLLRFDEVDGMKNRIYECNIYQKSFPLFRQLHIKCSIDIFPHLSGWCYCSEACGHHQIFFLEEQRRYEIKVEWRKLEKNIEWVLIKLWDGVIIPNSIMELRLILVGDHVAFTIITSMHAHKV